MAEHAPMPWVVGGDDWKPWEGAISVIGADYETICWTTSGGGIPSQANAATIVKSVNNHERLVETLQEARLQIEYLHGRFEPTGTSEAVLARINHVLTDLIAPRHT